MCLSQTQGDQSGGDLDDDGDSGGRLDSSKYLILQSVVVSVSRMETDRFLSVWSERELEREGRDSGRHAQNLRSLEGQTQCHLPVLLPSRGFEPVRSLEGFFIGTVLFVLYFFFSS